jgi:HD-GYP domain-containing protein (c-di-GMP phosphodiesterase class II)
MTDSFTTMGSLLGALARALNLIDPNVENHHQQTAYLSFMIARGAQFTDEELELTIYAALLHDIGFITGDEQKSVAELETEAVKLSRTGASILRGLSGAEPVSDIILHCQCPWTDYLALPDEIRERESQSARIASVIHLADVISTMIKPDEPIIHQRSFLRSVAVSMRDKEFSAEAVDAFLIVSEFEFIWMDLRYNPQFLTFFAGKLHDVSLDRTVELTGLMSRIIDYRSSFTAMHSAGVAASAEAMARLCGMSEDECKMMKIAGYLHDVGKLTTPRAILEKPGKLTDEEFDRVKEHPYYTRLILLDVKGFDKIADWAGFHHEKLDGSGYPYHIGADELDLGARIVAVADIFSAITEVRPYRTGMKKEQAMKLLNGDAAAGKLCSGVVDVLNKNYEEIDRAREEAARTEGARYYASIGMGKAE